MDRDEDLIDRAVIRLNAKLMGIVLGLLLGLGLFLATNFLVMRGGPRVGRHLRLLAQYFPGYEVTFLGSFVGFFWAFVLGFVIGTAIGSVYNSIVRLTGATSPHQST